jgi:hypothetical protein
VGILAARDGMPGRANRSRPASARGPPASIPRTGWTRLARPCSRTTTRSVHPPSAWPRRQPPAHRRAAGARPTRRSPADRREIAGHGGERWPGDRSSIAFPSRRALTTSNRTLRERASLVPSGAKDRRVCAADVPEGTRVLRMQAHSHFSCTADADLAARQLDVAARRILASPRSAGPGSAVSPAGLGPPTNPVPPRVARSTGAIRILQGAGPVLKANRAAAHVGPAATATPLTSGTRWIVNHKCRLRSRARWSKAPWAP